MAITLNHTIVPARDKEAAARLLAQLFGLAYKGPGELRRSSTCSRAGWSAGR